MHQIVAYNPAASRQAHEPASARSIEDGAALDAGCRHNGASSKHTARTDSMLSPASGSRISGSRIAGNNLGWSHTTTLEATPISASQARAFVTHHLVDHRLRHLVDPVRLVASELATNALLHAQTAFSVTLSSSATRVLLTVQDHSLALPERRDTHAFAQTGRGLDIVDIVSLEWGINEGGAGSKAVWASFAIM